MEKFDGSGNYPEKHLADWPENYPVNYLVNYHTHTAYCRHAGGTAEDYAQEAFRKGLETLGFSDHLPFPGDPFGYRMPYEEIGAYITDVYREKSGIRDGWKFSAALKGSIFGGKRIFMKNCSLPEAVIIC